MSRVSRITKYNPKKSVHDNALMNGVSDAAMYLYLRNNNKGRNFENAKGIVKEIKKVLKEHANQSLSQAKVAEITGHSVTTINKYWKAAHGKAEIRSTQAERTEKKRNMAEIQMISNISSDSICDILKKVKFSKDICCLGTSFQLFNEYLSVNGFSISDSLKNNADVVSCPSRADLSISFVEECMQAANQYVAFLMPLLWLSDNQLYESIFGAYPPSLVLPYTTDIGLNGYVINGYAWFVWKKGKKVASTSVVWVCRKAAQGPSPKTLEWKAKIDALIEQEHKNTEALNANPSFLPIPTKADLRNNECYDVSKHYCIAFRSKTDYWKDLWIPFGNMNGGFAYEMNGVSFPTSEQSYIFGVFSNKTEEHRKIQQEVLSAKSGYDAKRDIRKKNETKERRDWGTFNLDWMLYCVWQKVQQNAEFRELLLAIPQGVTIIEDTSFKNKPDKFWGCLNTTKKEFGKLANKYSKSLHLKTKAATERVADKLLWDYCNVGEYVGKNVMGKILTIIKDCLHKGTEPDIDYDLLRSKHIHFFGREISFRGL